ncbi:MAG: DUF805 domain-containing protein [Alphaproteobacteria bacterium]|nr:DUF805 domain-containing protein [Alphaproteobacteria bacterium]
MNLDELEKLAKLRERGLITNEEFELKKNEVLGKKNIQNEEKKDNFDFGDMFKHFLDALKIKENPRCSRFEYWSFMFFYTSIHIILTILVSFLGGDYDMILGFYIIVFFIPHIGMLIRRMRDTNTSPWLILTGIIPLIKIFVRSNNFENNYGLPVPENEKQRSAEIIKMTIGINILLLGAFGYCIERYNLQ